jgi:two-component system alkaline phosphatase synthesis response regulator PhoP
VDAIRLARQEVPDLIILDLVMPGLLGFEVCLALRQDEKFDRTAIVVTSAKSFKPDIDKAMELGADAYIVKPVEFADLLEVGREHMNKRVKAV